LFDLSFHKTPKIVCSLFPAFTWRIKTEQKEVYLTFDDGPIPSLTKEILDILNQYSIKATFFCVGENIDKHPEIFKQVINQGHTVGNHTYNHLKAWKVSQNSYIENLLKAEKTIEKYAENRTKLFRPPYGQFTYKLYKSVIALGYQVIMWDILTKDYSPRLNIKRAYEQCVNQTDKGSIVVFHDNMKARNNALNLLPMYINKLMSEGYQFKTL
jgi:peptidoglycan/xylan/chitin deacetylase (PgdA/CDA1 family)